MLFTTEKKRVLYFIAMNVSNIYDHSIKLIDDSYTRLLKIWALPRGSISKKNINNHNYYYYQYRDGNKIVSHILKNEEISSLRKQINERKKLIRLNKEAKINLNKNVKVISIFDKGLSASLMDELFAFSFDEIPFKDRKKVTLPFISVTSNNDSMHTNIENENIKEYFSRWANGEIRAREISNYIIKKISD